MCPVQTAGWLKQGTTVGFVLPYRIIARLRRRPRRPLLPTRMEARAHPVSCLLPAAARATIPRHLCTSLRDVFSLSSCLERAPIGQLRLPAVFHPRCRLIRPLATWRTPWMTFLTLSTSMTSRPLDRQNGRPQAFFVPIPRNLAQLHEALKHQSDWAPTALGLLVP
jgi:hypothetical protein